MKNIHASCKAAIAKCQPDVRGSNTIQGVIDYWNLSVEQSGLTGKYDFPTTGYCRFNVLQADLNRVLNQLETIMLEDRLVVLENDSEGLPTDVQQAEMEQIRMKLFPSSYQPEQPTTSEEAYAEAMVINARINATKAAMSQWEGLSPIMASEYAAHQINTAIDSMVSERQFIDVCQYDEHDESFRLVSLGSEFKKEENDWYRWAKATAIRLWEAGFTVTQPFTVPKFSQDRLQIT
ncbi:hypothetical protein EEAAV_26550 (plasmid) [Rahnella aceris]